MSVDDEVSDRICCSVTALSGLGLRVVAPWLTHGLSPAGGAHGFLDRHFQPVVDSDAHPLGPSGEVRGDQSLVQQSRHLYAYALLAEHLGTADAGYEQAASAARHLFTHLEARFFQSSSQPFVHQLTASGAVRDRRVQLYAQSFAIYGLSTYARVFGDVVAKMRARHLFLVMDELRHDGVHGGYDQREDGGWLALVEAPTGAEKCTNTHIHLLEALTPLCLLFPNDSFICERLAEMIDVVGGRLLQPAGYVHKHFARDFTPVGPAEVSYGHDLETAWLLVDALAALDAAGQASEALKAQTRAASRCMAEHALRTGWDERGGVFDCGVPEGQPLAPRVTGSEKIWWAQAEALPGLVCLYEMTRESALLERLEQTLWFIENVSWDQEAGEFPWGVSSDGALGPRGDHKGELWKTPYHALRACLLSSRWLASLA